MAPFFLYRLGDNLRFIEMFWVFHPRVVVINFAVTEVISGYFRPTLQSTRFVNVGPRHGVAGKR